MDEIAVRRKKLDDLDRRVLRLMHELGGRGQERHYFSKVDDVWTCRCGVTADKYGNLNEKSAWEPLPAET